MAFLAEPSARRIMNALRMFKQGADEEKAEVARLSSFHAAMAIGDLVKLTLGPKGMDKILWNMSSAGGSVEVTNDGATIHLLILFNVHRFSFPAVQYSARPQAFC